MFYDNGHVHIEDEDQCMTCENFNKGVACPLIQALGLGFVSFEEHLLVTSCGFFKKFERHLKVVSTKEVAKKET